MGQRQAAEHFQRSESLIRVPVRWRRNKYIVRRINKVKVVGRTSNMKYNWRSTMS